MDEFWPCTETFLAGAAGFSVTVTSRTELTAMDTFALRRRESWRAHRDAVCARKQIIQPKLSAVFAGGLALQRRIG